MSANGIMQCVLETARATLGKCHGWQTWPGVGGNEAAALARIYYDALPVPANNADAHTLAELQTYRPYILLSEATEGGFSMVKHATAFGWSQRGVIIAELTADVPSNIATNLSQVRTSFRTSLGKVLRTDNISQPGLAELSETPGMLAIHQVNVIGPARTDVEDISEMGDAMRVWIELHWGHIR